MSILRRYHNKGNIYFITNVTYHRKPILVENIDLIWKSVESVKKKSALEIMAYVFMPDHFHIIIDPNNEEISAVLQRLKMSFASLYRARRDMQSGRIWQNRFWDHIIRNQSDMNRHIDYIHYNPVKHGLVDSPFEWIHSSIRKYREDGYYQDDWGKTDKLSFRGEIGE